MPLATRLPSSTRAPTTASRQSPSPRSPTRATTARAFLLDVPFQLRDVAQRQGARWDAASKAWIWRGESLPSLLSPYRSELYSWERLKEDELNGIEPAASVPEKEIKLRKHQMECVMAVRAAVKAGRTGFLIADDVGLGKTMETWTSVMSMQEAETVLVVCPLAVVAHWRRTIRWMGDMGKRIVVINYDRLKKLFDVNEATKARMAAKSKSKRRIRTQKGIARFAEAYEFDLIVWDESHKLRNQDSARSKLAAKLSGAADFELWLSATAGQNPLELAYLSALLAESSGVRPSALKDYVEWCRTQGIGVVKGAYGKVEWRGHSKDPAKRQAGDKDLETMRGLLFDGSVPAGIRRTPTDIAGWPEVNRILMPVALDASDRALYEEAWGEFRRQLALGGGRGADSKNQLVARLRFRQKASLLRTGATADLALELLDQGLQVAISVAFTETLEVLREAMEKAGHPVVVIDGKVGAADKELRRLDFQNGRATVVIYTVEEGISLHEGEYNAAKRANIIHDLRWSGIQMKQIEGRTHRDGKFSQVYWMVGADTVEEDVAHVVANRIRAMSRMQGDEGTVDEIEKMLVNMPSRDQN
jgi:hypothetical protein